MLTVKLSRAYSNLAVLGDHGEHGTDSEVDGNLIQHAIRLLESVRTQGENDPLLERPDGLFLPDGIQLRSHPPMNTQNAGWPWPRMTQPPKSWFGTARNILRRKKPLEIDLKEREEFIRRETPDDVKGGYM